MMSSVLCESPRVRHPQEKCASKCVFRPLSLCLHRFFNTSESDLRFEDAGCWCSSAALHAALAVIVNDRNCPNIAKGSQGEYSSILTSIEMIERMRG